MRIEGGCRCGAVRYRIDSAELPPVYCCHCQVCQTWSGSAFTQQALISESQIALTSGVAAIYENMTSSGARSKQHLCGTCHTRLWNTNSARPGIAVVRAGTLDDAEHLVPRAHIWTKRKQPWIVVGDNVPQWPENAPTADFVVALSGKSA
ncbi:MAG: GFA family protein [Novosphingobium sp.]|nr:GFA family protein [Novosphingobium sp.]